jgi:hypothetical protein
MQRTHRTVCTDYESRWLGSKSVASKSAVRNVRAFKGVEDKRKQFQFQVQIQIQIRMQKDHSPMPETQRCLQRWQDVRSLHRWLVTQQVVASSPIAYTEELHEALNGGGLRSMSDSEHDMVCLTFTNENFTHWAVSCSFNYNIVLLNRTC